MSIEKDPVKGFSYRFDLSGGEISAVSIMFDVFVPGDKNTTLAVIEAEKVITETFNQDGEDLPSLSFGRMYFFPALIHKKMIVDICETIVRDKSND